MTNLAKQWILGLKKLYMYNQGLILGEAKEAVISGLPFKSSALFW